MPNRRKDRFQIEGKTDSKEIQIEEKRKRHKKVEQGIFYSQERGQLTYNPPNLVRKFGNNDFRRITICPPVPAEKQSVLRINIPTGTLENI